MANFIIYSGVEFSAKFTVMSDDGMTGVTLDPNDTGTFKVLDLKGVEVIAPVNMTIVDADNGVFKLDLTAEQTVLLDAKYGFEEDKYVPRMSYTGYMEFKLANSSDRSATIDVYVKKVA